MNEQSELFILADDVTMVPVASLDDATSRRFPHEPDDVVITRLQSRTDSKVISRELAKLLAAFRKPTSFAAAIYSFATDTKSDPQHVAEEVFGPLAEIRDQGFLVAPEIPNDPLLQQKWQPGTRLSRYTIKEVKKTFADSAVYQVVDKDGNKLALKLFRADPKSHTSQLFHNELAILQTLDNKVNPCVVDAGTENGMHFLVTDWYSGIACGEDARRHSNRNSRQHCIHLLDLCAAMLRAFDHLHRQKVLHGDINPDNILVAPDGRILILDYGYAVTRDRKNLIQRGGTGFFYEPEFAQAVCNQAPLPALTPEGEQYSLAALCYLLLTGHSYLDFSFDKERLHRQVAEDPPRSFRDLDISYPGAIESVLLRALSKNPANRFPDLAAFAAALDEARQKVMESDTLYVFDKHDSALQVTEFLLHKFGWRSEYIRDGLHIQPTCSVNFGAAGIAYLYYRASCVREDPGLSDLATIWVNRALRFRAGYDESFLAPAIDISKKNVGRASLYHSPTGVYLTQALLSESRNDRNAVHEGISGFVYEAAKRCDIMDLTLGKAGLLIGCSLLYRELHAGKAYQLAPVVQLAERVQSEIWRELATCGAMMEDNPVRYLGIAHGWAGYLYATILWCHVTGSAVPNECMNRVEEWLAAAIRDIHGTRWPLSVSENQSWPGWCNGSSGHLLLATLLYRYSGDQTFIRLAEDIARHVIIAQQDQTIDLCCGLSGNAYAMLCLYRTSGDNKYLAYARAIRDRILKSWSFLPLHQNSLFKGATGLGVLLCEMEKPELSRMPFFE